MIARPAPSRPSASDAPLVVAGLFSTANGIGEAARATYRALMAAGLSPIAVDLSEHLAPVDLTTDIPTQPMPQNHEGTLILQLNGPETMSAMQHLDMAYGRQWYTIGYWAWELPSFPNGWDEAFRYLSEIWTISSFTADALRQHPNAPEIKVFGHAISPPPDLIRDRSQFGWDDDTYIFITLADSMSSFERKNPFAAIAAFKQAFGDSSKHRLVVKTRNIERHPEAAKRLHLEIDSARNIELLDVSLSEEKLWELLNAADCFVSLHRSEGFGLVLAEAMSLGKPVIATGWSGNMDFTCSDTALLVGHNAVPCEDQYGIYAGHQTDWAEVDLASAIEQMRRVATDDALRKEIGEAARAKILAVANSSVVGTAMSDRLSSIPIGEEPVSAND